MTTEQEKLEEEAFALFNCEKPPTNYLVDSAGSIGPSKLAKIKKHK